LASIQHISRRRPKIRNGTTKSLNYGAGDQLCEHLVQLSCLAVSPSVEDLSFLESEFEEAHWKLYTAVTYRETLAELSKHQVPVILSECRLPDGNWKDLLSRLAVIPDRPRLIVFSPHADDRLWTEVLNLGGFDVLATPFRKEELMFAIGSAWLAWQSEQAHRPLWKHAHG
jgi:DNA-binding response OmpR family regulator